ncbi:DegT/DnrJ/EryC1/StrS family aminotransferase [Jidongwangia harbinensis]|uniref:DegT/DnrJ/EryC1/StrS family aminotransferase n=1 Tax=Jidongwangia harbinensis TaxID=2878561 RepID=UPI001CD9C131|nr:aminotransferase class I/II-fold pyridoxal phosphate-dependent enzyme [Jidongwangia harbinensis]MCA2214066.1 aminotransferase class I/II-fold pyridoxal phosphate-dependent enzyme [Jidongwangia harbinensis]
MTDLVYLSAPDVGALEEEYVLEALRSGWVAPLGPAVDAFEAEVAARVDVPYAVALGSGTAALHLALLGLGVGPGDVVLVPTLTFAATANAVVYTGAEPYFVDSEPETGNVDPDLVDVALRRLRRAGRRVAAVLTVDLFGRCADHARIEAAAARHGVAVVEDAAESFGSVRDGRAAGSFGRAAVLSFNGNKVMTTSGGGMLLTGDATLAARVRYLATQARQPVAHYEHTEIGYNYRLSNLLAALGRAQLRRLDEMIARRRSLRDRYAKLFAGIPGVRLLSEDSTEDNCWLTAVLVDPGETGWSAADLGAHLAARRVESRPMWKPMHLQPVFAGSAGVVTGVAERLFATGLVLPSGSALTEAQVSRVLDEIAGLR